MSLHYIYDNIHDIDADTDGNHVNVMSRNFQVFLSVERGDLGILKAIGIQDSQVLIILSPQVKCTFNLEVVIHRCLWEGVKYPFLDGPPIESSGMAQNSATCTD